MRLLLDTHVLLWALGDPARIPVAATEQIRDSTNELFVSAITPFELATKHRLGKLPQAIQILAAYDDLLVELKAQDLPITSHHGLVAGQLTWEHRDPFDRILAAQSIAERMLLVTSDVVFNTLGAVRTIWDN